MNVEEMKKIDENIKARKEAREVMELIHSMAFCKHPVFWDLLLKEGEQYATKKKAGFNAAGIEPMDNITARLFELKKFEFGKYSGKAVGDVAVIDPSYLLWLADEKDRNFEFKQNLKRYLANPTISREIDPDD